MVTSIFAGLGSYLWQFYLPKLPSQEPFPLLLDIPAYERWIKQGWGAFGWLDVRLPGFVYLMLAGLTVALLAAGTIGFVRARHSRNLVVGVFFGLVALTLMAGLHWIDFRLATDQGLPFIQGRYLLPLLPLLALCAVSALRLFSPRLLGWPSGPSWAAWWGCSFFRFHWWRPGSMRSPLLALVVPVVIAVVALAMVAARDERGFVDGLAVSPVAVAAELMPGREVCQSPVSVAEAFARVRLQVGTYARLGPALEVTIRDARVPRTARARSPGRRVLRRREARGVRRPDRERAPDLACASRTWALAARRSSDRPAIRCSARVSLSTGGVAAASSRCRSTRRTGPRPSRSYPRSPARIRVSPGVLGSWTFWGSSS